MLIDQVHLRSKWFSNEADKFTKHDLISVKMYVFKPGFQTVWAAADFQIHRKMKSYLIYSINFPNESPLYVAKPGCFLKVI